MDTADILDLDLIALQSISVYFDPDLLLVLEDGDGSGDKLHHSESAIFGQICPRSNWSQFIVLDLLVELWRQQRIDKTTLAKGGIVSSET